MSDVKIGITANAGSAKAAVNVMTDAVNRLAKSVAVANNTPFQAPGIEKASKDLAKLNRQFQQAVAMSAALRNAIAKSGQNADRGILNLDFNKLSIDPNVAQRLRDRAFTYAARGTAWDRTNVPATPTPPGGNPNAGGGRGGGGDGRGRRSGGEGDGSDEESQGWSRPFAGFGRRAARSLTGGIGGPVGKVADEGLDGAAEGAAAGGMGMAGGLLAGLGVGAVLVGLSKLGSLAAQGYDMAKERSLDVDTLKRQMGDLGVSFESLRETSEAASQGLGINAVQSTELAQQEFQSSHGAERTPLQLMSSVQESTGFARAYGLDPSQSVSFFGNMAHIDPRQSQHELALFIAAAIERTGGRALPTDVMQAVQGLTAAAGRMSLAAPDASRVGGAYASLVNQPGVTADNATSMLGAANSAVSNMGAAGEAGQYFIMSALNRGGGLGLNLLQARAVASEGLFGSRASAFSADGALGQSFRGDADFAALSKGPSSNTLTFDAIRDQLRTSYGDNKWLQLDAAQHLFGVSSLQQAAALMNMSDNDTGGLMRALSAAHINPNDVNGSGLQTIAKIASATSMQQLQSVYADLSSRTGDGALTGAERDKLDTAEKSGNFDEFRSALIKIAAGKDQQDTVGSDIRKGNASLENIEMDIGQQMVPAMNAARDALLALAGVNGKSATPDELRDRALKAELDTSVASFKAQRDRIAKDANAKIAELQKKIAAITPNPFVQPLGGLTEEGQKQRADASATAQTQIDQIQKQIADLTAQRDAAMVPLDDGIAAEHGSKAEKLEYLAQLEKEYRLPAGILDGIWKRESSEGVHIERNSYGAEGNFQQIDSVADRYGVHRGSFTSEARGAAEQLNDLRMTEKGDWKKVIFDYAGVKKNVAFGEHYYADVMKGVHADTATKSKPTDKLDAGRKSIVDLVEEKAPKKKAPTAKAAGKHTDAAAIEERAPAKIPTKKPGAADPQDEKAASKLPAERQTDGTQLVVLDIGVNLNQTNGAGQKTVLTVKTTVGVPRGAGAQRIGLTAQ